MTSAAAQSVKQPAAPVKLKPGEIRFLAMEGGGGKGFAYLGALGVLEELHVMDHVEGFAGASAGAITAFLLSIGYDRAKLEEFLDETDFNSFFDTPVNRARPIVGGCHLVDDTDAEKKLIATLEQLPAEADLAQWLLTAMSAVSGAVARQLT